MSLFFQLVYHVSINSMNLHLVYYNSDSKSMSFHFPDIFCKFVCNNIRFHVYMFRPNVRGMYRCLILHDGHQHQLLTLQSLRCRHVLNHLFPMDIGC